MNEALRKDPVVAALLACVLPAVGLVYVSVRAALIGILVLPVFLVLGGFTGGLAIVAGWLGGAVWAYNKAQAHNRLVDHPPSLPPGEPLPAVGGALLAAGKAACAGCGAPAIASGAHFCVRCGGALS